MKRSISRSLIENSKYTKSASGEMKKPGFDDIDAPDNHTTGKREKVIAEPKGRGERPKSKKVAQVEPPRMTRPRTESVLDPNKPKRPKIVAGKPTRAARIRREPVPRHQHNAADTGKVGKLSPNNALSVPVDTIHEELSALTDMLGEIRIRADMLEDFNDEDENLQQVTDSLRHYGFRPVGGGLVGGTKRFMKGRDVFVDINVHTMRPNRIVGWEYQSGPAKQRGSSVSDLYSMLNGQVQREPSATPPGRGFGRRVAENASVGAVGAGAIATTSAAMPVRVREEWSDDDWAVVMDMMHDLLGDERDPNRVAHAAEHVASRIYDDLGFSSPARAIQPIMQKWDDHTDDGSTMWTESGDAYKNRIKAGKAYTDEIARREAETARSADDLIKVLRDKHNISINREYAERLTKHWGRAPRRNTV